MPGIHGRREHDFELAELNQHRALVDKRAIALERHIVEATTVDLRREQREAEEAAALDALDPPVDLPYIDLTGDPDLDESGRF